MEQQSFSNPVIKLKVGDILSQIKPEDDLSQNERLVTVREQTRESYQTESGEYNVVQPVSSRTDGFINLKKKVRKAARSTRRSKKNKVDSSSTMLKNYQEMRQEFDQMKEKLEFILHENESQKCDEQETNPNFVSTGFQNKTMEPITSYRASGRDPYQSELMLTERERKFQQNQYNSLGSLLNNTRQSFNEVMKSGNRGSKVDTPTIQNENYKLRTELRKYKKFHSKLDDMIEQLIPRNSRYSEVQEAPRSLNHIWKFIKDVTNEYVYEKKRADLLETKLIALEQRFLQGELVDDEE